MCLTCDGEAEYLLKNLKFNTFLSHFNSNFLTDYFVFRLFTLTQDI